MKKIIIAGTTLLAASSFLLGTLLYSPVKAEVSLPDINANFSYINSVLDNHEARITNTENDVKDLQGNTSTPPSNTRTVVKEVQSKPEPTSSAPTESPKPEVVRVISSGFTMDVRGNHYCDLTYSDGTKAQAPDKGTGTSYTDENGQTHSSYDDHCQDYIGQPKN